ncbi:hypothetical protein GCM10011575_25630 [Microlunatus endophyticus]|uniref:Uncharacterized protein n=1 Tax=Microlunatus endophyticus TaxID=1716077 RepID=A0A917W5P2_9ACTN|nr:hypothetical protein [Microlunatus endophyticus]GGL66035.1 hypothetical protein GCM10011575_25630 [Microlunatus endophyticus]
MQLNASAVEAREHPTFGPQVAISASATSGRYWRPAHGRLRVMIGGSFEHSERTSARIVEVLSAVTAQLGHRGESEIDASQPGRITATWQSASIPLAELLQRAAEAVREVDPAAVVELEDETNQ